MFFSSQAFLSLTFVFISLGCDRPQFDSPLFMICHNTRKFPNDLLEEIFSSIEMPKKKATRIECTALKNRRDIFYRKNSEMSYSLHVAG